MNFNYHIILGSSSPRRQFLLREAGFQFEVRKPDVDEDFPEETPGKDVPMLLATKKAAFFKPAENQIIITSDTVVVIDDRVLNKPADRKEAISMLSTLSGRTHLVYTAVQITSQKDHKLFREETGVTFRELRKDEIEYYVDRFSPFDKAGSYGAQDCLPTGINPCSPDEIAFLEKIGKPDLVETTFTRHAGTQGVAMIDKINGSYFNVMGLPVHRVYNELMKFSVQ